MLVVAGAAKNRSTHDFALTIETHAIVPRTWSQRMAGSVPAVELLIGLCLIVAFETPFAAALTALLFAVFASAVALNIARGRRIECGCFGARLSDRVASRSGDSVRALRNRWGAQETKVIRWMSC